MADSREITLFTHKKALLKQNMRQLRKFGFVSSSKGTSRIDGLSSQIHAIEL